MAKCPLSTRCGRSEFERFRQLQGIVQLYTQVSDSAFKFGVTEQKLAGTQVAGLSVQQRDFGSAKTMRAVSGRLQPRA
jgi:hypothetical protein